MRGGLRTRPCGSLATLVVVALLGFVASAGAQQSVIVPYGFDSWETGGQGGWLYRNVCHCEQWLFQLPGADETEYLPGFTPFAHATPDQYGTCRAILLPTEKVRTWIPGVVDLLVRRHVELCIGTTDVEVRAAIDNDLALWVNGVQVLPEACPMYVLEPDGVTQMCCWENCAVHDRAIFRVPEALLVDGDNVFAFRARDRHVIAYLDVEILADVSEAVCNRPPDCSEAVASVATIWPPNHKKWRAIDVVGVVDPDGDPVAVTITGIRQDEPTLSPSSGNFCPDGSEIGAPTAWIRSEREGHLDGRVYHVAFRAVDPAGEACEGTVAVCVPHDMSDPSCGDQGPLFDSTLCN